MADAEVSSFSTAHKQWIQDHLMKRKGERHDRLKRGHKHGEKMFVRKIWWELFGHFNGLHPEYEVSDWRGKKFFVDFLWRIGTVVIIFEINGYGPHVEQMDRTRYRRELNRELFLEGLGFRVVSIPYDELEENPGLIRSLVKSIVFQYLGESGASSYSRVEREIMRLAVQKGSIVRPVDVVGELGVCQRTALKYLKQLSQKGKFRPVPSGRSGRITHYEYIGSFLEIG